MKQHCNTLALLSTKINALKIEQKANGSKFGNLPPFIPHFVQLILCCVHLWLLAFTLFVSL